MTRTQYRKLRETILNMTQTQLAEKLGVSRDTITRRESGKADISHEAELAIEALVASATPASPTIATGKPAAPDDKDTAAKRTATTTIITAESTRHLAPILEKIARFNEETPEPYHIDYNTLVTNDLLHCAVTGEKIHPFGNSRNYEIIREDGTNFVYFVRKDYAQACREQGLKSVLAARDGK